MGEIYMLGNKDAAANIAVRNLEIAKKFYEDTLGLTQVDAEGQEAIVFKSGNSTGIVYRSQYAGHGRDMDGRQGGYWKYSTATKG